MPNRYQLAFLVSSFTSFFFLFFLSRYVHRLLLDAGYDPANIILIGLPNHPAPTTDMSALFSSLRAVSLPLVGETDLIQIVTSPAVVASAFVIAGTAYFLTQTSRAKVLNSNEWQEFPLHEKIKISPNTAIYRFKLPKAQDVLGLPIGQHVSVSANINGKLVARSYTPVSSDNDQGRFDLLIKTYEKGNISRIFASLKIGDAIRVKGPKGNFVYTPGLCDHFSMIAGGTGITPMLQIIRAVLRNPADKTTISLIYANVNQEDILLRDDLEEFLQLHGNRIKIYFVLNNPPPSWKGGVGFVTKDHIKEHLQNPNNTNSKLLICGPPPMVAAMKKNLEELSFPTPNTISKLHDKVNDPPVVIFISQSLTPCFSLGVCFLNITS
ncbi:ferredoxin reductase-like protein [Macrolepiota fuliginosa MF-IS2]|uniref:NADH-cytochrome b5 reductase n=1 Tax=Macrolepiota fuliginosa MF-IS2 TaxID=1400762 RepID=A0A9P5X5F8_9AGAR|nr:ferredoxin reductase-like protein [Macrolepiota fuliginosa MF-IS2]